MTWIPFPPGWSTGRTFLPIQSIPLLFSVLAAACNLFDPAHGVHPIEVIQKHLPQDLSKFQTLAIRTMQPADGSFLDVARDLANRTSTGLKNAAITQSVSTIPWDAPVATDLELTIRVDSVRRVSGGVFAGATWVKAQVEVIATASRTTLGAATLGGSSAVDPSEGPPRGTTEGAIAVASKAIVRFFAGGDAREGEQ